MYVQYKVIIDIREGLTYLKMGLPRSDIVYIISNSGYLRSFLYSKNIFRVERQLCEYK